MELMESMALLARRDRKARPGSRGHRVLPVNLARRVRRVSPGLKAQLDRKVSKGHPGRRAPRGPSLTRTRC